MVVTIDKLNQLSIHLEYTGKQILIQYLVSYHAVEPLHHSICPWTVKLDRTVGDVVLAADLIKGMDLVRVAVFRQRAALCLIVRLLHDKHPRMPSSARPLPEPLKNILFVFDATY